jgi:hypothetical protein
MSNSIAIDAEWECRIHFQSWLWNGASTDDPRWYTGNGRMRRHVSQNNATGTHFCPNPDLNIAQNLRPRADEYERSQSLSIPSSEPIEFEVTDWSIHLRRAGAALENITRGATPVLRVRGLGSGCCLR